MVEISWLNSRGGRPTASRCSLTRSCTKCSREGGGWGQVEEGSWGRRRRGNRRGRKGPPGHEGEANDKKERAEDAGGEDQSYHGPECAHSSPSAAFSAAFSAFISATHAGHQCARSGARKNSKHPAHGSHQSRRSASQRHGHRPPVLDLVCSPFFLRSCPQGSTVRTRPGAAVTVAVTFCDDL